MEGTIAQMKPEDQDPLTSMNISLPASLKGFVDREVSARGYTSASEYVRELIRNAKESATSEEQLVGLLQEGLESGEAAPFEPEFFDRLRDRIRRGRRAQDRAS